VIVTRVDEFYQLTDLIWSTEGFLRAICGLLHVAALAAPVSRSIGADFLESLTLECE